MIGLKSRMNLVCKCVASLAMIGCLVGVSTPAFALDFDQDVTPDIIFGSGNANGGFTTDRAGGVELGLRGKLRFDENNLPQNVFNSNGDGTYTFQAGLPPTGFSFAPNSPSTPVWSFEWSINTDFDDSSMLNLADLTYELSIDADPGAGTDSLAFDPIHANNPGAGNRVQWDHAIGDNSTGNGGGASLPNNVDHEAAYATAISDNNVAQNSWNYEFFKLISPIDTFDPTKNGVYTITLTAFDAMGPVASTSIDINVIPEPGTIALAGLAVCGLVGAARRRRR